MPGQTDQPEDVEAMIRFCADKRSMQAVELLPYHTLGLDVRLPAGWLAACFGCSGA